MTALRCLVLEDSPTDAELAVFELERAGLPVVAQRVSTRDAFVDALAAFDPHVVLADYSLPNFDGNEALRWVVEQYPQIPVIIVSGALGDERAIELIKAGASDYVLKSNLVRLGPAVLRALEGVKQARAREQAERDLAASELRYRRLFEAARDGIMIVDADSGIILDVNPCLVAMLGYPTEEYLGKTLWEAAPFRNVAAVRESFETLQSTDYLHCEDKLLHSSQGARIFLECTCSACVIDTQRVIQWSCRDVTDIRLATQAAAEERERLLASLEQRVEQRTAELRALAFELTKAEERERQAIARDLHDDLGQILAIAKLKLDGIAEGMADSSVADRLIMVENLIDQSNRSVRSLATQLSPPVLYNLGLVSALEWLAEQKERDFGLRCQVTAELLPDSLDQTVRMILFRAVHELLANIIKHAQVADIPVEITVASLATEAGRQLQITVKDSGRGFDLRQVKLTSEGGFGLMSVRERLGYLGGSVDIDSSPGKGTTVILTAPLIQRH